jgi:hypothetical protein
MTKIIYIILITALIWIVWSIVKIWDSKQYENCAIYYHQKSQSIPIPSYYYIEIISITIVTFWAYKIGFSFGIREVNLQYYHQLKNVALNNIWKLLMKEINNLKIF